MATSTLDRRLTTRFLMACAAIGAVSGVVLLPTTYVATALTASAPVVFAALAGAWLVGPVVALRLLRRPGAGVVTMLVAGIISIPSPVGLYAVVTCVMTGVAVELGFLITGYRVWRAWLFHLTVGIGMALYAWSAWVALDVDRMAPAVQVLFVVLVLGGGAAFTALGLTLADRVAATGVARGVARR